MNTKFLDDFYAYLRHEKKVKPLTIKGYQTDLKRYMEWCSYSPYKQQTDNIRQYQRLLSEEGKKATTIKRHLSSLKSFYRWAVIDKRITADPTTSLTIPKIDRALPEYYDDDEVGEITNLLTTEVDEELPSSLQRRAMLSLLLYCGIRSAELTGLRKDRITRKDGVPHQLRITGKGGKERIVPVPEIIQPVIIKWIQYRIDLRSQKSTKSMEYIQSPILFPGDTGKALANISLRSAIQTFCKTANIRFLSAHKWRHTYSTQLIKKGVSERVIQILIGHSSLETTQIYLHCTSSECDQLVRQAYDLCDSRQS